MDYEVLIVGGGIQGVGLFHDLCSRRIGGVHLVEQLKLASGTSSRSTKLVHGGLRYLEHFGQWPLVREALRERATLLRVLRGIVQPVPFVLPNFRGGRPDWLVRLGLAIYDSLGGDSGLPRSRHLSLEEIAQFAPYLKKDTLGSKIHSGFLFYDAQMLDDVIVRVAARASQKLGGSYEEHTSVEGIVKTAHGYRVTLLSGGSRREVTARIVVNATGAWANANLLRWGFVPKVACLLNVGTHLVFDKTTVPAATTDSAAVLLQNSDGRVVFFIPWNGSWLLGTTESILDGDPRAARPPASDVEYLYKSVEGYIDINPQNGRPKEIFCGVRTMPIVRKKHEQSVSNQIIENPFHSPYYITKFAKNISSLSRESIVDETEQNLLTIYGGKYTTYRALGEQIGATLSRRLGRGGTSGTNVSENWFLDELVQSEPDLFRSSAELRQL